MEELKKLVRKLEGKTGKEEIVKILREIGEKLVTEYEIIVDGITVIPLWVEAYYYQGSNKKADERNTYKSCTGFIDPFVHGSKEQKGEENFGKLYFHHKTDDQRSGVDICLPLSDQYYLSFLLKYTLVNGEFTTQSELSGKIREKYNLQKSILYPVEHSDKTVVSYTSRIGISSKKEKNAVIKSVKEKYEKLELAIVRDFHIKYAGTVSLPHREEMTKKYVKEAFSSKEERAEFCKNYLGYIPKEFK